MTMFQGSYPADLGPVQHGLEVLAGIVGLPGAIIGLLEFLVAHAGVGRGDVEGVVEVQIFGQRHTVLPELLMVLAAGQRCQDEELEKVDGQFPLNDSDVAQDRLGCVVGKADDVARIGQRPDSVPGLEHGAILADLVLVFLGALKGLGVDVLHANEDAVHAGPAGLFDEALGLVTQGIDLDDHVDLSDPSSLLEADQQNRKWAPTSCCARSCRR